MSDRAEAVRDAALDVIVVGGGIVGSCLGYGLAKLGQNVAVLDRGDVDFRASRGNFGLVWVQGKGLGFPPYGRITRWSADAWPAFARQLVQETGIDPAFTRPGGLGICFSAIELEEQSAALSRLADESGGEFRFEALSRQALQTRLPEIGPAVVGAVYSPHDGCANPLLLLRALHAGLLRAGGRYLPQHDVQWIVRAHDIFRVITSSGTLHAARVVLAAGLGSASLAAQLGLQAPVRPVRGQILVTERLAPLLNGQVCSLVRQTAEGTCMIGGTVEEAGFDDGVRPETLAKLARQAITAFPPLAGVSLVRSWGALRIMTPDGLPIYQRSATCPGAWLVTVHSGVTLAPLHAQILAQAVCDDLVPASLTPFFPARFSAPLAA